MDAISIEVFSGPRTEDKVDVDWLYQQSFDPTDFNLCTSHPSLLFCACSFPSCHFGKLYGMMLALSAVFGVLQYPCFALVKGALNGDPLYVSKRNQKDPVSSFSSFICCITSPAMSAGEHRSDVVQPARLHPSPLCLPALSKAVLPAEGQQLLLTSDDRDL